MPLSVSLFQTAEHSPSNRVSAAISDSVIGPLSLGYPHVLLTLSPPVYGCARPAARGVDTSSRMMEDARKQAASTELPKPYEPKVEGGKLDFELALYNALRDECAREELGVRASDLTACSELLMRVRDALWQMAGREVDFKCSSQVRASRLASSCASHPFVPPRASSCSDPSLARCPLAFPR
jgi:hypothetical protein